MARGKGIVVGLLAGLVLGEREWAFIAVHLLLGPLRAQRTERAWVLSVLAAGLYLGIIHLHVAGVGLLGRAAE